MYLVLNLQNDLGSLISLWSAFSGYNKSSGTQNWETKVSTDNANVIPVNNKHQFTANGNTYGQVAYKATFLLNRDNLGDVTFKWELNSKKNFDKNLDGNFHVLKRFQYEDPTTYLLNEQIKQEERINQIYSQVIARNEEA